MRYLLLLLLFMSGAASAQTPAFISDSLDRYIHQGMTDWNIPGLAIAIVKDGHVVYMKGFGTREVGKDEPVDTNTLFFIASNTKLFTGTAVAQLDEAGRLSLDDHVSKFFPGFRLYDTNATRMVDVRDMLSHQLGTKTFQGDFTFWNSNLSREAIIAKIHLLKPSGKFRRDFGYCNSCFLTAGEIVVKASGGSWESYVQQHFLDPLGMTHTHTQTVGAEGYPDMAHPYTSNYGDLVALPYDNIDNLGPAGALVSCVSDMSHWLQMQLDSGRYAGRQVVTWGALAKTRVAGTIIRSSRSALGPTHFVLYGLGVLITDYHGKQVYWHTGGAMGFVSNTCFVPEDNLAICILTNNDDQSFFEALRYQILDAYLGAPFVNRSHQFLGPATQEKKETLSDVKGWEAQAAKGLKPSLPMSAFAGVYTNPVYGKITITQQGNGLVIHFEHHPGLHATLDYMGNDKFLMRFSNIAYGIFPAPFTIGGGKVKNVTVKVADGLEYDPYVFVKD